MYLEYARWTDISKIEKIKHLVPINLSIIHIDYVEFGYFDEDGKCYKRITKTNWSARMRNFYK